LRVQRAAAEYAGADEVPERSADDVKVGERILKLAVANPPLGAAVAVGLDQQMSRNAGQ